MDMTWRDERSFATRQASPTTGGSIRSRNDIGVVEMPAHRIGGIVDAENFGLDGVSMRIPDTPGLYILISMG